MGIRATKKRLLVSVAMGLGLALTVNAQAASNYPDIGPLPNVKINKAKAELGKRLFFDPRLSGNAAISCAHCHNPEKGYADGMALSDGYPGNKHFRNSPTVINAVHQNRWMWDGRLATNLNDVTRGMLTEDYIMNMDMRIMQERVKQDPMYVKMFKDAGYGEPSNASVRKAIPEYLKTLTSKNAPFDTGKMSASAKRGKSIFKGKAGCIQCHNGANFTDGKAYNTGVPENWDVFMDTDRHQAFLAYNQFMGVENYNQLKRDAGAHIHLHKVDKSDMGTFLTPSLRELTYTAPYMHNGMVESLEDVVAYYNNGGGEDSNKDSRMKKLGLTDSEQKDLVAFLKSLSGDKLTGDKYVWSEDYPEEYEAIENWHEVKN